MVLVDVLLDGPLTGLVLCFLWCFGAAEKKVQGGVKKRLTGWLEVFRKRSTNDGGAAADDGFAVSGGCAG